MSLPASADPVAIDVDENDTSHGLLEVARDAESTRRRLTTKQARALERLLEAAVEEARERGYESATVRGAARRAGISPATAYTFFASKDHLLAEVLWRRMKALPEASYNPNADALERVTGELRALALFVADDEPLATACTTALLGSGPEVRSVRVRFGNEVHRRLASALGEDATSGVLQGLDLAYSGAMLWAGMGHMTFAEIPDALAEMARTLIGTRA
jgi:AcrR family transcriptional regulator